VQETVEPENVEGSTHFVPIAINPQAHSSGWDLDEILAIQREKP
jgi:hypothetical protein